MADQLPTDQEAAFDPAALEAPAETPTPVVATSDAPLPPRNDAGKFTHPKHVLDLAEQYLGWDADTLKGLSTAQIQGAIIRVQQRELSGRVQNERQRIVSDSSPAPRPEPEPEFAIDLGKDSEGHPLTIDDVNPAIAKSIRALEAEVRRLGGKTKKIDEIDQRDQHRTAAVTNEMIDDAFESLGAEKLYGKGDFADLAKDSPEWQRRIKIYQQAGILPTDGRRKIAQKIKAVHDDLAALFGTPAKPANDYEAATETPAKPSKTVEEWNGAAVARPTQRRDNELPPGKERAIRKLAQRRQTEMAMESRGDSDELNGLPD